VGHAAMFLGQEDGLVYWWSSTSDGWGVSCSPINLIAKDDFAITRVENPNRIKEFLELGLYVPVVDKKDRERFSKPAEDWSKRGIERDTDTLHSKF